MTQIVENIQRAEHTAADEASACSSSPSSA
ncbi:hypothetical protein J2X42_003660 [Arthrobacter sp. BE255]|nr:hypothetical protein [Arthrobacter sp. BE255]